MRNPVVLRRFGIHGIFSTIFLPFCDFLFAFLHTKPHLDLLLMEFLPVGRKTILIALPPLKVYKNPLSAQDFSLLPLQVNMRSGQGICYRSIVSTKRYYRRSDKGHRRSDKDLIQLGMYAYIRELVKEERY